ncbi:MAG: basic rane protein [Thermoleophilales bacterium]|jgi:basic membrane lipoprotein Med (substrate-binding protein (PBP1-ABC) superfamily)|nr:basic rane protein [Thermoleophilales bacterium]
MSQHRRRGGRRRPFAVLLALAVLALFVAACGSDNKSSGGSGGGGGTTAAGSGGSGGKKLRVAILLPGSVSDETYNADGQRTADLIKKETGSDVTVTQSVQLPNQTDVYSQFARQGYDLVIGWGGQFTDGAVAASKQFPKTQFLVVNSTAENGTNLNSMDESVEQWQFLGGYAAAKMSKSGTVGWVGGQCFPATAANLNGTKQGAEYGNKDVKFLSTFTGDFEDPTKGQQAAQAQIDKGADWIAGNLNNGYVGLYKAAEGGKAFIITEWADNHTASPTIGTTVVKKQGRFVLDVVKRVQEGTAGGKHYQIKLPEDYEPVVVKTDNLPEDVYAETLAVQKKVASGEIKVERVEDCPK